MLKVYNVRIGVEPQMTVIVVAERLYVGKNLAQCKRLLRANCTHAQISPDPVVLPITLISFNVYVLKNRRRISDRQLTNNNNHHHHNHHHGR